MNTMAFQTFALPANFASLDGLSIALASVPATGVQNDWWNNIDELAVTNPGTLNSYQVLYRGTSSATTGVAYVTATGRWF